MKRLLLTLGLVAAAASPARAEVLTAITDANYLLFFDHATPGTILRAVPITGLGGANLVGIDYRPANGTLYALSDTSRLFTINTQTAVATAVGSAGAFTLNGTRFGFNFNPTVDRIRVTSDTDQNLRLNPNDGALVAADGALAYAVGDPNAGANPNIVASAYTNSFIGSGATVLYGIDSTLNRLVIQNPPNNGTLVTVGALSFDPSDRIGFDISAASGRAYGLYNVAGIIGLYTIDLASGASALFAPIGPPPEPVPSGNVIAIAAPSPTKFVNLSSRGMVGTGDNVMIGGFVARGAATTRILVRALGPSLTALGVTGALADTTLTVFNSAGTIVGMNDDWASPGSNSEAITATGLAPTNALESAVILTLPPGAYTGVIRGKGGATGVALIEAYEVP